LSPIYEDALDGKKTNRKNSATALILTQQEDEDPWKCKICSKMFKDHDAKLLECQRCNEHF
jgi:hypothetical protein